MKVLLLVIVIVASIKSSCQNMNKIPDFTTTSTHNLFIGRYAGALVTNETHCLIIGDFDEPLDWPSYTIYYDKNFWYFKTKKGKELLKYLASIRPSKTDIIKVQDYILRNHLTHIQTNSKPKD